MSIYRQLAIAFTISVIGIVATLHWYEQSQESLFSAKGTGEEIGWLKQANAEVERRIVTQRIWQPVSVGERLHLGEAIRVPAAGTGQIELSSNNMTINLDSGSVIVLEETKEGLELNLVSGSLYVKQSDNPSAKKSGKSLTTTIKAGNSKIDLNKKGTELSLSMSGKNASVAVTKGDVQIRTGQKAAVSLSEGKVSEISERGVQTKTIVQITTPAPNAVMSLDKSGGQMQISWVPLPAGFSVNFERGASPTALRRVGSAVRGEAGSIRVPILPGVFYWRLTAASPQERINSIIMQATGMVRQAPQLVSPASNEKFPMQTGKVAIPFSWTKPPSSSATILQVASTRQFKNPIFNKTFVNGTETMVEMKRPGQYFYRVLAEYAGAKSIAAKPSSFLVMKRQKLKPPGLASPPDGKKFFLSQLKGKALPLEWTDVLAAEAYEIEVYSQGKVVQKKRISDTQFRLLEQSAGQWSWKVRAVSSQQELSPWSSLRRFTIASTVELAWLLPKESKIEYTGRKPWAGLAWQPGPKQTASYRLRSAVVGKPLSQSKWRKNKSTKIRMPIPAPGNYQFEVQALSASGAVLGRTDVKLLQIEPSALLPAPKLQAKLQEGAIVAKPDGSLAIQWSTTSGASKYKVILTDRQSGKQRAFTTKRNRHRFTDLLPGSYTLEVGAVNARNEVGELSTSSVVRVPQQSNIAPPSAFEIKVH